MNCSPTSTTSCNIDDGICQLLTQNPNQWMSAINLYNQYTKEHSVNKKDFIINCELLNTRFKNIRKYHKNNICYLAFVTNDSLISKEVNDEKYSDNINNELFRSLDSCEVIEYMIKNPSNCEKMSFTEYFDENDTLMHILFKRGRIDLVKTLMSTYDIDFDIKNRKNESLLDVLNFEDKSAQKLVNIIFEYRISKLNETHNSRINSIKQTNTTLIEVNKKLADENNLLRKQIYTTKIYKYLTFMCFISFLLTYFFK